MSSESTPEHGAITAAATLMPIYYQQKQWHEDHGRFASSLEELGLPPQRSGWTLTMEPCGDGFSARLVSPHGTATVNETGRLERTP